VLHVPVRRLQRLGISRSLSIGLSLVGTLVLIVLLLVLIVPVFVRQVADLGEQLPDFLDSAQEEYNQLAADNNWMPKIYWNQVTEGDISDFVLEQAGDFSRQIFPFLGGVGGAITNLAFVFFIAIFLIAEPADYLAGLLTLMPRDYRPRAFEIFQMLGQMLQRWFVGQLISMVMSGILITFITGVILGLPNAVALGVVSGLMEFIPNFGSISRVIPAVIIALAEDPVLVPFNILAYLTAQQIQSNVIMPRIMSRQISIPAASILIAQIIGAALFGFLGVLLALPMAIVVMVLVREMYVYDLLNARAAELVTQMRPDGTTFVAVSVDVYRPEQLTPGQAALIQAEGRDPFAAEQGEIIQIITPPSPALEQTARSQQAVWAAILVLTVAQGLALVRSLLGEDNRRPPG
jgi:predicted PurR-regulated permease PerM